MHKVSINELINSLGIKSRALGRRDGYLISISRIEKGDDKSVTFCNKKGEEGLQFVRDSRANAVICSDKLDFDPDDYKAKTIILVPDPRLAMLRIMQKHFIETVKPGIAKSAAIDKHARIHSSACIGPNSYIGRCEIGENCVIHGGASFYANTKIGDNVLSQAGAAIGAEGLA